MTFLPTFFLVLPSTCSILSWFLVILFCFLRCKSLYLDSYFATQLSQVRNCWLRLVSLVAVISSAHSVSLINLFRSDILVTWWRCDMLLLTLVRRLIALGCLLILTIFTIDSRVSLLPTIFTSWSCITVTASTIHVTLIKILRPTLFNIMTSNITMITESFTSTIAAPIVTILTGQIVIFDQSIPTHIHTLQNRLLIDIQDG